MDEIQELLNDIKEVKNSLVSLSANTAISDELKTVRESISSLQASSEKPQPMPFVPLLTNIKPFSGDLRDLNLTIDEFEVQYKRMAKAMNWTESQSIAILPSFLRTHALEVFHSLQDHEKDSLEGIFCILKDRFYVPELAPFKAMQLRERKQGRDESVASFAADIKRLARTGFANKGKKAMESAALQAFQAGLRHHLKERVFRKNPASLDEAILIAAREEVTKKILEDDKQKEETSINTLTQKLEGLVAALETSKKKNKIRES